MARFSTSALITDNGDRVLLRLGGRHYELTQPTIRQVLDLPDGPPGLGITIDGDRLHFEFAGDDQSVTISAAQLQPALSDNVSRSGGHRKRTGGRLCCERSCGREFRRLRAARTKRPD